MSAGSAPPLPTARGSSPPSVRQFSVFLDNRVGKLYELLEIFEDRPEIHLCALSVMEATDHAVIRIITNNSRMTRELLRQHGLPFSEMDLLIVELKTQQSLATLCLYLLGAELNIQFAYPLMLRSSGQPTIALSVDDKTVAGQVLLSKNFRLLGEADLLDPTSGI